MILSQHLYTKKGRKYVPATPGQVVAETTELLHRLGMSSVAFDLAQRITDHQLVQHEARELRIESTQ